MYCSEYFNVSESLVWTSNEIIKIGGILAKTAPKKGKTITTETLHLVTNVYKDENFTRSLPEKNGVHNQKLCNS